MGSSTIEEKSKAGFRLVNGGGAHTSLEGMKILQEFQDQSERKKTLNSELWHACAGPLVSLPQIGSRVYYFPQGHSEQVEVSTKGIAGSHIPNYPNLPSQLMCHVQNVTLHADKDTDEIYAQMTLQPMNPEEDIFPVIDFGIRPNKHPSEFFCKTLTASDTSTHGGFSVPRRAAEKLFPPLDYSMQPPTQELVVRDLHDNSWTFRHIYRGQPKRHLLTSGWSLLLSAKRLRAGDAVLFVRDEKSQLRLGVRRANRGKTTLPSSILSVDSMHIGVLAAAAHAASNRSPFTIFYNPRACPSEFVVPLVKYQKAVYGPQVSIGMRFGMMFETEESGKRRYMGMVVGISDIDPQRWPGSKWRNLQVEWDEPGRKHKRVGSWEIETPESLFVFPSLSSTLKRSLCSGFLGAETEWKSMIKKPTTGVPGNGNVDFRYPLIPSTSSELVQMLLKPENVNPVGAFPSTPTFFGGSSNRETQAQTTTEGKPTLSLQNNLLQIQNPLQNFHEQLHTKESSLASNGRLSETDKCENQLPLKTHTEKPPIVPEVAQDQQRQLTSLGKSNEDIFGEGLLNCQSQSLESQLLYLNQRQLQEQPGSVQQDTALRQNFTSQMDRSDLHSLPPCPGNLPSQFTVADDWISNPSSYQSLAGILGSLEPISGSMLQDGTLNPIVCSFGQEAWDPQLSYLGSLSHSEELSSCLQQDTTPLQSAANSCVLRDFPEESNDQSEIYSGLHFEVSNGGRAVVDLPFPGSVLDMFSSPGDVGFLTTDNCLGSNISSTPDIQSQITTTSLGDPHGFSLQDFPDCTGGTSSRSSLDFDESSLLLKGPWQQVSPPLRTYTKVQMLGSVGRSIDVTKFKNYNELRSAIACMFGIEAFFDDPGDSGWKLVYVDYENDVLLVGDDPWEEFVSCVRCIRILSPSEVQQMSEDGNQLISNTVM